MPAQQLTPSCFSPPTLPGNEAALIHQVRLITKRPIYSISSIPEHVHPVYMPLTRSITEIVVCLCTVLHQLT